MPASNLRFQKKSVTKPVHGGNIHRASQQFGIPVDKWLDLSTGINPNTYPITDIPESYFKHLPSAEEPAFIEAAKLYYDCEQLVAAPGSQRLIELLPGLHDHCRVAIPDIGYQEHLYCWQQAGHEIIFYDGRQPESLDALIGDHAVDVAVVINPCNPTAANVDNDCLERWRYCISARGGHLIIDEAFADLNPDNSFASYSNRSGVIVLRSLGKFFGLAGLRVGFALAETNTLRWLASQLDPWSISGPSIYLATRALLDNQWQRQERENININAEWMVALLQARLQSVAQKVINGGLFVSVLMSGAVAERLYIKLASQGVLVRLWPFPGEREQAFLRFGLISDKNLPARERFQSILRQCIKEA